MKNPIITLLLLLFISTGFSQNLKFEVRGTYSRPVKKENLIGVKTMADIRPGYPSSWITDYISVEIMATNNGKVMKAVGKNDILSSKQISLISRADLGTDIVVDVKYRCKNSVTGNIDVTTMNFSVTIVPEIEAEYLGGYQLMTQYLKDHAINKISEEKAKQLKQAIVRFTINENGEIANAQISSTSEDQKIDDLLLEVINNMPKWKPAENAQGIKVKQEFVFSVGSPMSGC